MSAENLPVVSPGTPTAQQLAWQIRFSAASAIAAWLGLGIVVYATFLRGARRS